jgi:hypothetical protein
MVPTGLSAPGAVTTPRCSANERSNRRGQMQKPKTNIKVSITVNIFFMSFFSLV